MACSATQCPICFEDITDESKRLVTKCNHVFHEECLLKWIDTQEDNLGLDSMNCPVCREEIKQYSIFPNIERKAEYMATKLIKWLDELTRDCHTYEECCDAINKSFARIPSTASLLIEILDKRGTR
jgi:hypothetical protein